jgi:Fe-S oxidoreductase
MKLENVILTTDNCRYCLMCRHVASVERITHKESLSPHGWALLIASVRRGLLRWDAHSVDVIYSAPDNGNSRAHCVFDQPLPEAIAAARAEIVSASLAPQVVYQLDDAFKSWGNPYRQEQPQPMQGRGEAALFVGDEAQYFSPVTLSAALTLLKATGVDPVLIGIGRNSGYMASSLGLPETAAMLAQANLAELEASEARRLFVLSPGDYFTFKQLYDERLGINLPSGVDLLEVSTYLANQYEGGALKFKKSTDTTPYAYVDPTHAVRVPDRHNRPRSLLKAVLPGSACELFWRMDRAHPVGNTALQFTKPELAEKLTRARLEDARQSGAGLLVTDDPSTCTTLEDLAGEYGLRVKGLYELLADQLE